VNRAMDVLRLVLAVVAVGCGSSKRSAATPTRAVQSVAFVGSWSDAERERMAASVRVHVEAFERAHGPLGFDLELHRGTTLPGPDGFAGMALGRRITLACDPHLDARYLTHELHHVRHDPGPAHADARWATWDLEDEALAAAARAR
jgi:hypothetical protein